MKSLVVSFLFLIPLCSSAQDNDMKDWSLNESELYFKFSPLDVFSIMPTFGLDVETSLTERIGVQLGAGFLPNSFQMLRSMNNYDRMSGYRVRGECRYYLDDDRDAYFAGGLGLRHLIISDEVAIGMEGVSNDWGQQEFAYFINTPMVFHRFTTFLDLKYGYQFVADNNFVFDMYVGLSLRNINVQSYSEIPEGGVVPNRFWGLGWTLEDNHNSVYPTPIVGFKLGFKK